MNITNSLENLFSTVDLTWIDNSDELIDSNIYHGLLSIFPNLREIFKEGKQADEFEFYRTLRHIFRVFKIYFLLKNKKLKHNTLSIKSLNIISNKLNNQNMANELYLPLILIYHDIGRFFDRKNHPSKSYYLISNKNLLKPYTLSDVDNLLIKKVIEFHLFFATIYTGESTFYGIYSLINNIEFTKLLFNENTRNRFIDLLEIFTYIDILGYSYAHIYDHYIDYYNEINYKLKALLKFWPDKDLILRKSLKFSQEWLEWRIAGALRIFQYIDTKDYLTKEFYFGKIKECIKYSIEGINDFIDWEQLKDKYLMNTLKIQIKYGLAVLMLLAFGKFFRGPIKKDSKISNNLILFWILLSKEISKRSPQNKEFLWNIHFNGLPNWRKWDGNFKKKLNYHTLNHVIKNATQDFDKKNREINLIIDLDEMFSEI
ncbi:MAG: hypothetical protein ACFFHD_08115 [Promethearchaeota archaeon]